MTEIVELVVPVLPEPLKLEFESHIPWVIVEILDDN
jgi:hypothetical protein